MDRRTAAEDADAAGVEMLVRAGVHADGLSRFFARLQDEEDSSIAGWIPTWLSPHPPTEARRKATARDLAGSSALSEAEWQELKEICAIRE